MVLEFLWESNDLVTYEVWLGRSYRAWGCDLLVQLHSTRESLSIVSIYRWERDSDCHVRRMNGMSDNLIGQLSSSLMSGSCFAEPSLGTHANFETTGSAQEWILYTCKQIRIRPQVKSYVGLFCRYV